MGHLDLVVPPRDVALGSLVGFRTGSLAPPWMEKFRRGRTFQAFSEA